MLELEVELLVMLEPEVELAHAPIPIVEFPPPLDMPDPPPIVEFM
jgi:hypothetical protein